jgi:hypothetical protein
MSIGKGTANLLLRAMRTKMVHNVTIAIPGESRLAGLKEEAGGSHDFLRSDRAFLQQLGFLLLWLHGA